MIALLVIVILIITFLFISLSGCTITYPFEKGSRWVCMEPYFILEYRYEDGRLLEDRAFLEINGLIQPVIVGFQGDFFLVAPVNSIEDKDRFLTGSYHYRGGQLVFSIDEDFVFDGAYKEIVFSPEE